MLIRKWERIIFAFCCCMLLAGCWQQVPSPSPSSFPSPSPSIQGNTIISLNASKRNNPVKIDDGFIGLSFELSEVCEIIGLEERNPAYYERLFLNLGHGVIHIGGHSADFGVWRPDGSMYCSAMHTVVTREMITIFFAFVAKIHWQVIWGLNLIGNDPQSAANEAAYVASVASSNLLAFNIGNEPDLYAKHGFRPANWGYPDYRSEWEAYYTAIHQLVPGAQFVGSDACCESPFFYTFISDESGRVTAATRHFYAGEALYGSGQPSTIPGLLNDFVAARQAKLIGRWEVAAHQMGVPLEITESNSFSNGGIDSVSNTYGAALWVLDYLCQASFLGVKSIEFQNGQLASYNALDDNGNPTPLYYGLLFFHTLVQSADSAIVSMHVQTLLNVTAYEVVEANGTVHLVVINKDLQSSATVGIEANGAATKAQILRFTAPKIDATSGIKLGGVALSNQGNWSSSDLETIPVQENVAYLTVPQASAVELTFS